jgi:hypothetical protein
MSRRWKIGLGVVLAAVIAVTVWLARVPEVSKTGLVVGVVTWGGGVAAWVLAAAFEYRARHAGYREKKAQIRGAIDRDPEYAQAVGDIEVAVANQGFPRPEFGHCLLFTAYQPLLTLAIISIPTFRVWDFVGWVALVVNVFAMFAVLILTFFHETPWRDDSLRTAWHPRVTFGIWVGYLLLILWLAQVSEEPKPKDPPKDPQAGVASQP